MKIIIISLFFVLVTSCASSVSKKELIENNPACQSLPASNIPAWVVNPISSSSIHLYGVGVTNGMNMNFNQLRKESKQSAEAELASSIQVNISASLSNKIKLDSIKSKNNLSQTISQVIESSTDIMLRGVGVDKVWLNRETCQLWTLVIISKEDVKKSEKEMQGLVNIKLNTIGEDISSIKSTIESDPSVILRKYNLQLTQKGFIESIKRNINPAERSKIFSLYNKYHFNHENPVYGSQFMMDPGIHSLIYTNGEFGYNIDISSLKLNVLHIIAALPSPEKYNFSQLVEWAKLNNFDLNIFTGTYKFMDHYNAKESYRKEFENSIAKIYDKYRSEMYEIMDLHGKLIIDANTFRKRISEIEIKMEDLDSSVTNNTLDKKFPREPFTDQFSPIHFAAAFGTPEAIKVLVKNDVSIKTKTEKGKTVYDIAKSFKNERVLSYLNNI